MSRSLGTYSTPATFLLLLCHYFQLWPFFRAFNLSSTFIQPDEVIPLLFQIRIWINTSLPRMRQLLGWNLLSCLRQYFFHLL